MMIKYSILWLFMLATVNVAAQKHCLNDTLQMGKFKGIICDSSYAPYYSRNIFPKNRFKPTIAEVKEFEAILINQYAAAIIKHHDLFYAQNHGKGLEDEQWLADYKSNGIKFAKKGTRTLKREYNDFDRNYYGYMGRNGKRYLRVEFTPHHERWYTIEGTGEQQLYNLPILVYNLDTHTLSLSGWTGEHDGY